MKNKKQSLLLKQINYTLTILIAKNNHNKGDSLLIELINIKVRTEKRSTNKLPFKRILQASDWYFNS